MSAPITVSFSPFARCGSQTRIIVADDERALTEIMNDLGREPREIVLRRESAEVEVRLADEIGGGALLAVVDGLAYVPAQGKLVELYAKGWLPKRGRL